MKVLLALCAMALLVASPVIEAVADYPDYGSDPTGKGCIWTAQGEYICPGQSRQQGGYYYCGRWHAAGEPPMACSALCSTDEKTGLQTCRPA
jgi:hypothetical protein